MMYWFLNNECGQKCCECDEHFVPPPPPLLFINEIISKYIYF